jgi:asparagine synthase (glutamine-hydrolysing)
MESAFYMRNQLLRDADWASMAHSLELRTPLVDVGLLRTIAPMQHALVNKSVLADAMELKSEVRNRPKTGFTTPVGQWISSALEDKTEHWARSWARRVASEFRISEVPGMAALPLHAGAKDPA